MGKALIIGMGRHINLAAKDRAGPVGYQRNTAGLGQGIVHLLISSLLKAPR